MDIPVHFNICIASSGPVDKRVVGEDLKNVLACIGMDNTSIQSLNYQCDIAGCETKSGEYEGIFEPAECSECGFKFDICVACRGRVESDNYHSHHMVAQFDA